MQREPSRKPAAAVAEMAAAVIDRFGPPSVLHRAIVPVPEPGPREVLIALHAAGVGSWDESMRDGSWKEGRVRFPRVIDTDGAGVVVARGARVKRFRIGDRVYSASVDTPQGGFYAQYVAVSDAYVAPAPRRLDFAQAAAVAFPGLNHRGKGIDDQGVTGRLAQSVHRTVGAADIQHTVDDDRRRENRAEGEHAM